MDAQQLLKKVLDGRQHGLSDAAFLSELQRHLQRAPDDVHFIIERKGATGYGQGELIG